MFAHMLATLNEAEAKADSLSTPEIIHVLRALSFDDFSLFFICLPNPHFPKLSQRLPAMASEEVQVSWTGESGVRLLRQSLTFMRLTNDLSWRHRSQGLGNARLLDLGCGYGRLLRLMYYYSDPERIFGCDPWERSIELCREAGLLNRLDQTDYLPKSLPYEPGSIDIAVAFSVFTHTSLRATQTALQALRQTMHPDGMFVATVRPIEFWNRCGQANGFDAAPYIEQHQRDGFAFWPHQRGAVDGDVTYGDTSIDPRALADLVPGWRYVGYEHSLDDELQVLVALKPA